MNKQIINTLIIICFFVSLVHVSALSSAVYKQSTEIEMVIPCFLGGDVCTPSAVCNLTIQYKNGTYMVDFLNMTNLGNGDFQYFLNENQTSNAGTHPSKMVCWDGQYNGTAVFSTIFTPTGYEMDEGQGLTAIGIIIAMLLLTGIFGYYGFKLSESDKLFPIALFFMLISLIIGVFAMQLSYIASRDILVSLATEGLQFKILLGTMWGLIGIAFISLLFFMLKVLKEFRERKSNKDNSDGYDKK